MKTARSNMELVKYDKEENQVLKKYKIMHQNDETILEQTLTVARDNFGRYKLSIEIDDFPIFYNETEAVLKYADWLERLGVALRREAKESIKRGVK